MTAVRYDVVAGDYMAKIAAAHGTTIGRIWSHPDNAAHRARRGSPDVLYAGDVLWIPDQPDPAPPSALPDQPPGPVDETGAPWPYPRARGPHPASTSPAWCSHVQCQCHPPTNHVETTSRTIVFYDHQGQRLAKARCRVWYNGRLLNLERPYADAEGKLTFEGPDGGADVLLEWAPEHTPLGRPYPYRLRYHLDVGGPNGLRRRLHNLGFSRLPTLEENVRAFQAAYCLDVTGRPEDIEERLLRDYDALGLEPVPSRDASPVEPSWLKDHKTALERLSPAAGRSALRAKAEAKTGATKASSGGATTGAGTTTPVAKIQNLTLRVRVQDSAGNPIDGAWVAVGFGMPIDSREGRTRRGETVFSAPMGQLVLVVVSHHNHGPPNPTGRVSPAIIAGVVLLTSNGLAPLARQVLLPWPFPIQRPRVTGDGMTVVDDTNPQDAIDDSMVLVTMEDAGNIMLTDMADWFRAEGLAVIEEPGWDARGAPWAPSGGMIHHTGPPVPFAVEALYPAPHGTLGGGRIKANFNVKPDGTVHVIAAGACTYASGPGNTTTVLKETRLNIAPSGTASARRLGDTGGGNRHFINCEADHLGDGSIMPAVQERAVIRAYNAIFRNLGWPAARLVGHCEWTTRKVDPRWNGTTNRTPHLRADIGKLES